MCGYLQFKYFKHKALLIEFCLLVKQLKRRERGSPRKDIQHEFRRRIGNKTKTTKHQNNQKTKIKRKQQGQQQQQQQEEQEEEEQQ